MLVEDPRAGGQRAAEGLLLAADRRHDQVAVLDDDRVGLAHDLDRALDHRRQDRPLDAEQVGEADGPPDDPAQDVAPVLVGGDDPVGDEEGHRPGVVGHQPQGDVAQLGPPEAVTGDRLGLLDEGGQRVGGVQARAAGQDGHDPLEARAGVDVLLRQVAEVAVGLPQVLGEDEVPDLDVALLGLGVGRAAVGPQLGSVVPEDLRGRPTGAGLPHLPEVVGPHALDALAGEADAVGPDLLGLVVALVDRHPDAVGVQLEHLGDELPGPGDGVGLEVVAEAEVPQHLEEAEVAATGRWRRGRCACPGPHAPLDRGGAPRSNRTASSPRK